jgi:plasmid maintenance system killer protein
MTKLDFLPAVNGGDPSTLRINQQWRICFEWPEHSPRPFNIEIVDYH